MSVSGNPSMHVYFPGHGALKESIYIYACKAVGISKWQNSAFSLPNEVPVGAVLGLSKELHF